MSYKIFDNVDILFGWKSDRKSYSDSDVSANEIYEYIRQRYREARFIPRLAYFQLRDFAFLFDPWLAPI